MLSVLIGSLSVLLGWLLNEITRFFSKKRSEKKVLKQVLYELLEVHFIITKLDLWDVSETLLRRVEEAVQEKVPENEKDEVMRFIQKLLLDMIEPTVWRELNDVDESYHSAIGELSSVDPIIAYRLRNKTRLLSQNDTLRNTIEELKGQVENENDIEKLDQFVDPLILRRFKQELSFLTDEMIVIAEMISKKTKKEVEELVKPKKVADDDDFKFITASLLEVFKNQNSSKDQ